MAEQENAGSEKTYDYYLEFADSSYVRGEVTALTFPGAARMILCQISDERQVSKFHIYIKG